MELEIKLSRRKYLMFYLLDLCLDFHVEYLGFWYFDIGFGIFLYLGFR